MGPTRRVLLPAGATRGHLRRIMIPVLLTLALLISCRGDGPDVLGPAGSEDLQGDDPSGPVMVSDAVFFGGQSSTVAMGAALAGNSGFSWVSFPPSTYPEAEQAHVRNIGTGLIVNGPIIDGGLDPTPVLAEVGDSVEVTALKGGLVVARTVFRVPERRPPVIVRSQPPRGRKAVPINFSIILVFSEPVDDGSLGSGQVVLRQADTAVPTRVTRLPDGFTVQVDPLEDLEPASEYSLRIGTGVTDLSGDHLEVSHLVDFETETLPPELVVIVSPDSVVIAAGMSVQFSAQLVRGPITYSASPDSWSSSDPSVAVVSAGLLTAVTPGFTDITATFGENASAARVTVVENSGFVLSSVAAGGSHTCGLTTSGVAFCWGSNVYGQLGDGFGGPGGHSTVPVPVAASAPFASLSAGGNHTCGLTVAGDLYCWGLNADGQLGDGSKLSRATPQLVSGPPGLLPIGVSAGGSHTCALTSTGTVYCWGANDQGQVGTSSGLQGVPNPVPVTSGVDREGGPADLRFTAVAAGPEHTCGITDTGEPYCWGSNAKIQLGHACDPSLGEVCPFNGTPASSDVPLEHPLLNFDPGEMVQVSAGGSHTCLASTPGSANATERIGPSNWYCWGEETRRAHTSGVTCVQSVGIVSCEAMGTSVEDNTDVIVSGPAVIGSGLGHACALLVSGTAYCWGADEYGQRGDGSHSSWEIEAMQPVQDLQLAALAVGDSHTCGVTFTGEAYCWGRNDLGQLGDGSTVDQTVPVRVVF